MNRVGSRRRPRPDAVASYPMAIPMGSRITVIGLAQALSGGVFAHLARLHAVAHLGCRGPHVAWDNVGMP